MREIWRHISIKQKDSPEIFKFISCWLQFSYGLPSVLINEITCAGGAGTKSKKLAAGLTFVRAIR